MSHAVSLLKIHLLQLRQSKYLPMSHSGPCHGECLLHVLLPCTGCGYRKEAFLFLLHPCGDWKTGRRCPCPQAPAQSEFCSPPAGKASWSSAFTVLFTCWSCRNPYASSFPLGSTELYNPSNPLLLSLTCCYFQLLLNSQAMLWLNDAGGHVSAVWFCCPPTVPAGLPLTQPSVRSVAVIRPTFGLLPRWPSHKQESANFDLS